VQAEASARAASSDPLRLAEFAFRRIRLEKSSSLAAWVGPAGAGDHTGWEDARRLAMRLMDFRRHDGLDPEACRDIFKFLA